MNNKAIERIVQRQIKANERILKEIGKVIGMIGDLNPSEAYTIAQQLKYGESLQKIVKILSKNSRISELEIYKMLEKEAKNNLALKEIYYKAKKVDFIPYKDNLPLQALVNEVATSTIQTYRNISRTTGLTFLGQGKKKITKPIQEAYWQIIDDAIMNVSTGKQTFDQVMKDQLETIGNAGIQSIEYESGYHRRIDSALRMNLQEGLSRLANEQQELLGEQFGANMVEVSHHEAPAPDHADTVDGKQFARIDVIRQQIASGVEKEIKESDIVGNKVRFRGKWYEDYDYVNDNLERPVSTLNCYHYAFTGVLGVTKPRYSKEELEKDHKKNEDGFEFEGKHYTMYEGQQLMNRVELELRKARETKLVAEESGNQELLWKAQNRERLLASKYHKLSKASGLPTRGDKIQALSTQTPEATLYREMKRREQNLLPFGNLEIPMQKREILKICRKYDIDTTGLTFKIQRNEKLLATPYFGSTDYDNIGRIDLFPNAFLNEKELIKTILHEKEHVVQLKRFGKKYVENNLAEMEKLATLAEKEYNNLKRGMKS